MSGGTDLREAAVAWAARGFRVFPLVAGGKIPAHPGWTESATADVEKVRILWTDPVTGWARDWNIGTLTNDLIVVDVDMKNGKNGWVSFMELDLSLDTLIVETPSGGAHVYYSGPSRANSAGRLGDGLDIRSHHGFVVAPGSLNGIGAYILGADLPVAGCPGSLLALLDAPRERADQAPLSDLDTPAAVLRAIEWLEDFAPLAVEGQSGDATTFKVAATLKDYGLTEDTAVTVLLERWNERCLPPWTAGEIKAKVANAYAYGANAPGSATPQADMAGVIIDDEPARPRDKWTWHGDDFDKDALWTLFEVLPKTGVAVLVAPPNAGKTFLLLELARCGATMKPFFGVPPEHQFGTAFVFGGTEGSGFERRLAALGETKRLPIAGTRVTTLGVRGAMAALLADLQHQDAEMQLHFGIGIGLVVFETLSATGLIDDENDNAKMAQAVANLSTLGRQLGCPVIITHHPTKDGRSERGGGALRANVDYVYEITKDGRSTVADLKMTKARDAQVRQLGAFTLLPVKLGADSRGREITSATVSMSSDAPTLAKPSRRKEPPHLALFLECLDWALAEEGEMSTTAQLSVEVEAVREIFKERKPGNRDRGNMANAFKAARMWAEEIGAVKEVLDGARRLFVKGEIIEDV